MDYITNFTDELAEAKWFEDKTQQMYESLGYQVERVENIKSKRKLYDLKITKDEQTYFVEIKWDKMCIYGRGEKKPTGNLFFECESRGEPSGFMNTKANFWVHWYDLDKYILITDIKRMKRELRSLKSVYGGDENSSYGKIVALREIPKFFDKTSYESTKSYCLHIF